MSRSSRRILISAFGMVALLLSVAALAWACTPAAYIDLSPSSGQPGTSVTVNGRGFAPGPVEIRWGGATLATATGPNFSTAVTIPNAAPGVYYLEAATAARAPDGAALGRTSRAFRVTGPDPQPAAPPSPATSEPPPSAGPAPSRSPLSQTGSGRSRSRQPATAAAGRPSGTATGAEARVLRRSASPVDGRNGAAGRPEQIPESKTSARSASSDLWSGFSPAGRRAPMSEFVRPVDGPGAALIPGLALFVLGLLALAGGVAVVATRRRRRRRHA